MIFHGGYKEVRLPEIIKGKYAKDFGAGFYCTELKEQAIRWARRFDTPVVGFYDFKPDTKLRELVFSEMSESWLDFVGNCRADNCFCSENALNCLTFMNSENYDR